MGDIAAMSLDELAEFVVTLDGWKWDLCFGSKIYPPPHYEKYFYRYVNRVSVRGRPDLTDPATLGCLLAMVRRKYGEYTYTVYTLRGWRVMTHEACESVESYMMIVGRPWGEDTISLGKMNLGEIVIDPGTGEEIGRWEDVAIKLQSPSWRTRCVVDASEEMPTEAHALVAALAKGEA